MKEPKKKGRPKPVEKSGGKALERLHQFEQERGLEPTDVTKPRPDRPPSKKEQANEGAQDDPGGARTKDPPSSKTRPRR